MSFENDREFNSEAYVKVNVRLMQFWAKHPEGRIETDAEIVGSGLIVKAKLFKDSTDRPISTGHAFLEDMSGDKVGEYTETVAIGRALAIAGFSVEKSIASGEEMKRFSDRQDRKSNEKVQPKVTSTIVTPSIIKSEADAKVPQAVSATPEVPRTLKPSRVFKPLARARE